MCPTWANTGQLEQHISGDVVFAARQLVAATGGAAFLAGPADALAAGVADWLVSRVRWDGGEAGLGAAHIDGVIPPDEYAEGDDSVR